MHVHLNPPLEPGNAPRHAAAIVATAADISGAELDYSLESIALVEDIVDGFRAEGVTGEDMAESLIGFGCYVGEILARRAGGTWRHTTADHPATVSLVVELPDARESCPIDWVFHRLKFGAEISIRALCEEAGASRT
ncbi:hypothetical protein IAG44_42765 [Streptomyces roseirectus]|uniref:DUF3806 domain-containing protein n=1 Tax=Streptomyces roseirectus TaxID=2768066 RepID=A0A7H0IRQ5_9ACTN|nr:hypothetical protein [Streptomyces roseirectus]QNP75471.1 hypothetical protein IAG44_42765 [Streptomyces roseirectus]